MKTFCTIITSDFYPYAQALYASLIKYNPDTQLQVLVVDSNSLPAQRANAGIVLHFITEISGYSLVSDMYKKYAHLNADKLRWALKPPFLSYLLEHGFSKTIYADCDIFFFNDHSFLFDELDESSVLLTPHWTVSNPVVNEDNFLSSFEGGLFNAGFIGASVKGIPALRWWAEACLYRIERDIKKGLFDDQRYLDAVPVLFEDVKIIRHKGCNVATWNYDECKRILVDKQVMINGKYPIIFIHFNTMLVKQILKGHDNLLLPYFLEYKEVFEKYGGELSHFMKTMKEYHDANLFRKLKWRLKLRTRIKNILYQLSRSL